MKPEEEKSRQPMVKPPATPAKPQEKKPESDSDTSKESQQEERYENGFGILPDRDLKRNLGCG